jgi:hypothetical protein
MRCYVKSAGATLIFFMLASLHVHAENSEIPIALRGSTSPFDTNDTRIAPVLTADDDSGSGDETPATTKPPSSGARSKSGNGNGGNGDDSAGKHVTFETVTEATTYGGYSVSMESFMAPFTDLETTGFRLSINTEAGGGMRHNGVTGELNRSSFTSLDLLFGYALEAEKVSMKFMAGATVEEHKLSAPDPTDPVQGITLGMKFKWEVSYNPVKSLLVYSDMYYSTAFHSYYADFKFGYDVTSGKELFVGPEVSIRGNESYNEVRFGAHATEYKIGKVKVGFSGGGLWNSDLGWGAFGFGYLNFDF